MIFLLIAGQPVLGSQLMGDHVSIVSTALGQSDMAIAGGLQSIGQNSAGITTLRRFTIQTQAASAFENAYQTSEVSFGGPISDQMTLALSVPLRYVSNIPQTIEVGGRGVAISNYSDIQVSARLVGATQLTRNLSIGVGLIYARRQLLDTVSTGYDLDAGMIYSRDGFSIGLSAHSLLGHNEYSVGGSWTPMSALTLSGSVDLADKGSIRTHVGATYTLSQGFTVMGGANGLGDGMKASLGLGLDLDGMHLNYAMTQHPDLGISHTVGLTLQI